jgi:hypothetical protein
MDGSQGGGESDSVRQSQAESGGLFECVRTGATMLPVHYRPRQAGTLSTLCSLAPITLFPSPSSPPSPRVNRLKPDDGVCAYKHDSEFVFVT